MSPKPTPPRPDSPPSVIRLNQADTGRVLGCTRQHISMLVKTGRVPVFPDGRLDPSAAVSALLQEDPAANRLKALVEIRRRIEDAEARATEATRERDRMAERLAELSGGFRAIVRLWLESEEWLNRFRSRLDAAEMDCEFVSEELLDEAFDGAAAEVLGACLAELCMGKDPDALAMIARLDPESGIQPSRRPRTDEGEIRPDLSGLEADGPGGFNAF